MYDSTDNAGRIQEDIIIGYRDGQIYGIYILMLLNVKFCT